MPDTIVQNFDINAIRRIGTTRDETANIEALLVSLSQSTLDAISTLITGQAVADTIAAGQITLSGVDDTEVVPERLSRKRILISNTCPTIGMYLGPSGVTTLTGLYLAPNDHMTLVTTAAIYAIAANGTPMISYLEEYN